MEQPQTIGDDKQPDVEWDPPPALDEKFTAHEQHIMNLANKPIADLEHLNEIYKQRTAELEAQNRELSQTMLTQNTAITELYAITSDWERRYKELEPDATLGASLRLLPECTSLIRTPDRNGPQEWTVIIGDYDKPDYYANGSTPEEALRNLFQCMAGES